MSDTQEDFLSKFARLYSDNQMVTVFGKEMSEEALDMLIKLIGNSLNVIAEYGAINKWSEEEIKSATKSAAVGVAFGLKSLVYFKEDQGC